MYLEQIKTDACWILIGVPKIIVCVFNGTQLESARDGERNEPWEAGNCG